MLIKVERNKYINFLSKGENVRECRMKLEESVSEVNEKNKFLIIGYGGYFPQRYFTAGALKEDGFKIVNIDGKELDYIPCKKFEFIIPYKDISEVMELYFCYGEQKIKITVE